MWSRDAWRGFSLNSLSSFLCLHFFLSFFLPLSFLTFIEFNSFKMSSPSPDRQSPAPLSAAEELSRMMREVTPLGDDEGINIDLASTSGGQQMSSPSHGAVSSADGVSPLFGPSGPMRSIEQRAARRLADRLNLFPYQKDALNELVKVVSVLLYTILLI